MGVSFIDTSILCNLLPVPGRDQHRAEVIEEFRDLQEAGETFILPVTTVIETGNFIAQISNGSKRRSAAQRYSQILESIASGSAPWVMHQFEWDTDYLRSLISGAGTGVTLVDHAVARLGGGDLCILAEREIYRARANINYISIWTKDMRLAAHS